MSLDYLKPFALNPSIPFVLSLSKERTGLRTGLSKSHSWFDKLTTNGLYGDGPK